MHQGLVRPGRLRRVTASVAAHPVRMVRVVITRREILGGLDAMMHPAAHDLRLRTAQGAPELRGSPLVIADPARLATMIARMRLGMMILRLMRMRRRASWIALPGVN